MRRPQKKGQKGNAAQYLTRNQALKKLQLKLSEFRRLCILKGIHPREPRKKPAGRHKTYYHAKDVLFLAHEPLLNKFRADAAFERRVRRARAKRGEAAATALEAARPTHTLDHLVAERYPTLADALADADDALSLVHLFAALPPSAAAGVPAPAIAAARTVALEWQAWVASQHALRKAFISVKGFYFQARARGVPVTWLAPHALAQVLSPDVDFRVMLTFLELGITSLRHVLARLYADAGARYPPRPDPALAGATAVELDAVMRALAGGGRAPATPGKRERAAARAAKAGGGGAAPAAPQAALPAPARDAGAEPERRAELAAKLAEIEQGQVVAAAPEPTDADADAPPASSSADDPAATLFRGLTFFIGREVPREPLLLVLRSFGGAATWEGPGAPLPPDAPAVTHAVVDRPLPAGATADPRSPAAAAVVPQWAFDSANWRVRADERRYRPGAPPPPHPSPFADVDADGGHVPAAARELEALRAAGAAARGAAAADAAASFEAAAAAAPGATPAPGPQREVDPAAAAQAAHAAGLAKELGLEAAAVAAPAPLPAPVEPAADADRMRAAMLPRKKRVLYESVRKAQDAKRARGARLAAREKK